jgi:hypothetical protein
MPFTDEREAHKHSASVRPDRQVTAYAAQIHAQKAVLIYPLSQQQRLQLRIGDSSVQSLMFDVSRKGLWGALFRVSCKFKLSL